MKMKTTLKPLSGKYYGTEIIIDFEDGQNDEIIKLWCSDDFIPSIRQLEKWGYTQEQWDNNEEMDNGWDGTTPIRDLELTADGHFERKSTYERAMVLINKLK
jgi:hypothetical protein